MATSSCVQQQKPSLNLDLSLGGIFSQPKIHCHIKCSDSFSQEKKGIGKELEYEKIRNHKRARMEEHNTNYKDHAGSSSLCNSYNTNSGRQSPTISCTSFVHGQATPETPSCTPSSYSPTQKASCLSTPSLTIITPSLTSSSARSSPTLETDFNGLINNTLPTKRKSSRGGEEEKSCNSSSSEQLSTSQKKVTELEAPRSSCDSNSDTIGSMGPSEAIPNTNTMMYTHPFAMLPIQVPSSMPIQLGYALPYAMHYSSHMMPPLAYEIEKSFLSPLSSSFASNHLSENTSLPWIPFVLTSTSGSRPGVLASSCNEGKLQDKQEISCEEDALTCGLALSTLAPSAKNAKVQTLSQIKELTPAMVHENISDVCTSATSSSSPLFSTSPMANNSSRVCTSSTQPLMSSTSPTANYSSDSCIQADPRKPRPVNEVCRSSLLKACSNLSTTGDGVISHQFFSHNQMSKAGLVGNNLCGQSQHNISPGRKPAKTLKFSSCERELVKSTSNGKPTKTVRFSFDERKLVKSISNEDMQHASSSLLSESGRICISAEMDKSVKKMLTSGGEALCSYIRHNGSIAKRITQDRQQNDGNANTRITSESSDPGDSAGFKVEGAHKLEGKNVANLPRVSITCAGPNDKTIYGVMYITKSKQMCLICNCHGTHMSPSEFVQHSGSTDLSNPERSIVVTDFSCVKQVV